MPLERETSLHCCVVFLPGTITHLVELLRICKVAAVALDLCVMEL